LKILWSDVVNRGKPCLTDAAPSRVTQTHRRDVTRAKSTIAPICCWYLFANRDRHARAALLKQGAESTRWAQGSGYRWFWLTTKGLQRLATWAQAHGAASYGLADGETVQAAYARAAKASAKLHREVYSYQADQAEAKLAMQREQFATKLAATEAEVDRTSEDLLQRSVRMQDTSL
jgi:hypothetical protein